MNVPRPRNAPPRAAGTTPMRVPATIVDVGIGVREGLARLDTGGVYRVILPDVLWLRPGDRVLLYRYPDGWVAVLRIRIDPGLSFKEGRRAR